MACVKPDGSLTLIGRAVLGALAERGSPEKAAETLGLPLYRVRLVARALAEKGLVVHEERGHRLTPLGEEKLGQES